MSTVDKNMSAKTGNEEEVTVPVKTIWPVDTVDASDAPTVTLDRARGSNGPRFQTTAGVTLEYEGADGGLVWVTIPDDDGDDATLDLSMAEVRVLARWLTALVKGEEYR